MVAPAPSILLVEPSDDIAEMITELLEQAGYGVRRVSTLNDASDGLAREDFALLLVDQPGPDHRRIDELLALKEAAAPTPVGVLTAWSRGPVLGDFAFVLLKPFDGGALLSCVARFALGDGSVSAGQERLVRAYFDALSRADWPALGRSCTEDVRYSLPGSDPRHARTVQGRQELERFAAVTFRSFPEARFTVRSVRALPARIVASYETSWRLLSGELARSEGAVVFRLEGDRIAEIGIRTDPARLRAAG